MALDPQAKAVIELAIKAGRPRVSGSGGSFLPPHLGSTMYAEQLSTVPVVNMLLGSVVGIGHLARAARIGCSNHRQLAQAVSRLTAIVTATFSSGEAPAPSRRAAIGKWTTYTT